MIAPRLISALRSALLQLRALESEWRDLAYPDDDRRGAIPDSEMPPEWIQARELAQCEVCRRMAIACGVAPREAEIFADEPLSEANPYNVQHAQRAIALSGKW